MQHTRWLVAAFALVLSSAFPAVATAQQVAGDPPATPELRQSGTLPRRIEVAWFSRTGLSQSASRRMHREVEELFEPLGIDVQWHPRARMSDLSPSAFRVRVSLVTSNPGTWGLPGDTLGAVLGTAIPRRSIYVFYPNISRVMGYERPGRQRAPASLVGRALGRVVAHEIVHALAPWHPHQEDGLMSSGWRSSVLAGLRPYIDDASRSALLEGLDAALEAAAVSSPHPLPRQ